MDATDSQPTASGPPRVWPWASLAVLAALIFGYVLLIGSVGHHSSTGAGPGVGQKLPFLQLQPLDQGEGAKTVSLEDLAGRVTLVNYWGTWCGPCLRELPDIVGLQTRFGPRDDFQLCAVSCGDDDTDLARVRDITTAFLEEKNISLPVYFDQAAASRRALFILLDQGDQFAYPTTILLDRQGVIRGIWQGYDEHAVREMSTLIRDLLDQPADQAKNG